MTTNPQEPVHSSTRTILFENDKYTCYRGYSCYHWIDWRTGEIVDDIDVINVLNQMVGNPSV